MASGAVCFVSGSRIRAARGEISVDEIVAGDELVVLRDGHESVEPVKWVGQINVDLARHAYPEEAAPVRIKAGAIADNQPVRDLLVSPEHSLIIDGLCVPAKLLVNGGSIVNERGHRPFTYHHVELEKHGIIQAENLPTESYLDTGNRSQFDNAGVARQLHPRFSVDTDSSRWQTDACAPMVQVPDQVEPIWSRLAQRSQEIGHPLPQLKLINEADIHLVADGRSIYPSAHTGSSYVFIVPAGAASVSLVSRYCIPADKGIAAERDTRRLGVRVHALSVRSGSAETVFAADHPGLTAGWHDAEKDSNDLWRWTDGTASIPWSATSVPAVVSVDCTAVDSYPVYDEYARLVA
jgi:Hint domain